MEQAIRVSLRMIIITAREENIPLMEVLTKVTSNLGSMMEKVINIILMAAITMGIGRVDIVKGKVK